MSLTLITGPMFSGKTTELLRLVERERIVGKKCIIVKHAIDIRYTKDNKIKTHADIIYDKCEIRISDNLNTILELVRNYDVVAVEEGHFFGDIKESVNSLANSNIKVIVSALNGTYHQTMFKNIEELLPLCENVIKLNAVCMSCKQNEASFSIRLVEDDNIKKLDENNEILVGGADSYKAVCRTCLNKSLANVNNKN